MDKMNNVGDTGLNVNDTTDSFSSSFSAPSAACWAEDVRLLCQLAATCEGVPACVDNGDMM